VGRLLVHTDDRVAVPVRVFETGDAPWAVVLINPATEVPQRYYAPFALWLAQWGVRVVTYDYRGLGDARPSSLRGFPATLDGWAEDARAVIRFASRAAGRSPVVLVGHGFGGQLLGLVDEMDRASGAVVVGPALDDRRPAYLRGLYSTFVLVPVLTRLRGYLPAWAGPGVDLPAGVARDWSRSARRPGCLMGAPQEARLRRFHAPVLAYSFAADDRSPNSAVKKLLTSLGTKRLKHRHVDPDAVGRFAVGPLGVFRPELGERFWPEVLAFVRQVAIREARARSAWTLPNAAASALRH
jgi:predicted alpha/beta hydrolase